ncbi:MAG: hypothetical protein JNK41_12840 [Saprospiraceae bacterium]|jgi:outer membrane biosynthesis protein TonB|nr:hypothetical protein [Saprospiraceae bacterium]
MLAKFDSNIERKNWNKGLLVSAIIHALLAILLFLPLLEFPDPPPPKEGILVSLGRPDEGMGDDRPMVGNPQGDLNEEEVVPEPIKPTPQPESAPPKPTVKQPTSTPKVMTSENAEDIAIKRSKEEAKRKEKAEQDTKDRIFREKQAAEEAERKRIADENAKMSRAKSKYGDMFKNGGTGRGNTGKPGNQGDPNGDPNSDVLTGKSTGNGKIGGGLQQRGGRGPSISAKVNDEGVVVIKVCVDGNGDVISADYTQSGSTTNSSTLINLAKENARRYNFKASDVDKQCGTITYNFILK